MTTLIKYHAKTFDIALFCSSGEYWIGEHCPRLTHQNGEPPYLLIEGYFDTEAEGLEVLRKMDTSWDY